MKRYDKRQNGYNDCVGKHEPKPYHNRDTEIGRSANHVCKASARQLGRSIIKAALDEMEEDNNE